MSNILFSLANCPAHILSNNKYQERATSEYIHKSVYISKSLVYIVCARNNVRQYIKISSLATTLYVNEAKYNS